MYETSGFAEIVLICVKFVIAVALCIALFKFAQITNKLYGNSIELFNHFIEHVFETSN